MGATAFIMASFLNIPYLTIAIAAAIPAILYYGGLLIQVDAHAALHNLRGLSKEEVPLFRKVFREGWYYLITLVLLIFFLILRLEARAPFFAIIFLFLVTNIRPESRLTFDKVTEFVLKCGQLLTELVGILAAVGLIVGSLAMTGLGHAFSRELVVLAGGNIYLLLLLGAITSFILGMGMTVSACYIFLAIVLAPGLVQAGLNELAVHLFVAYCGMLSYITPPVGLAIYPAAAIAGGNAMRTGLTAMRLGAVTFIIPLFFVLNPALILQGNLLQIMLSVSTAIIGVFLLASGLAGYVIGVGKVQLSHYPRKWVNILLQVALFFAGILLAFPEGSSDIIGLLLGILLISIMLVSQKVKNLGLNPEVTK